MLASPYLRNSILSDRAGNRSPEEPVFCETEPAPDELSQASSKGLRHPTAGFLSDCERALNGRLS